MTIKFKEPKDLIQNFTNLEMKNLFLIQQTQEAEQEFEERKQDFIKKKAKYEKEINGLKRGLAEVKERIALVYSEMDKDQDSVNEMAAVPKELRKKVCDVFTTVFVVDQKSMVENKSTLYLLAELEKLIEDLLRRINEYKDILNPSQVNKFMKAVAKERKNEKIQENKDKQAELDRKRRKKESKKQNMAFVRYR